MSQHMRRHHPTLFGDTDGPAPKKAATTSATASAAAAVPTAKQTKLFNIQGAGSFNFGAYKSDSERAKDLTRSVAKFLAKDMRPYSLVESPHFKELVGKLDPRYKIPGRKKFSGDVVPAMYAEEKEKVKAALSRSLQVRKV